MNILLIYAYERFFIIHYEKPHNVGSFDKNDPNVGTGLVGAPACGDVMIHWPIPGIFPAWECSIGPSLEYSLRGSVPLAHPWNVPRAGAFHWGKGESGGKGYIPGARPNHVRRWGMYLGREQITCGEGAHTWIENQSREGMGHILGVRTNHVREKGIYLRREPFR